MNKLIISLLLIAFISSKFFKETETTTNGLSCAVERTLREECGSIGINQDKCEEKGCCWKVDFLVPWCFKALNNNKTSEAVSATGLSVQEILEKKIEEIEKKIAEGKTDFKKIEEDILKSFQKTNSKMQEKFKTASKIIRDFLDKHALNFEEAKGARKK